MCFIRKFIPWVGWILFLLLAWPLRERIGFEVRDWFSLPSQSFQWAQKVDGKIEVMRDVRWQDPRPLVMMLGDSQVEMGDWYDLFQGGFSVRNGGLSQAKVSDVIRISEILSSSNASIVCLQCGINDLGAGSSVKDTLGDYSELLRRVSSRMGKDRIIVVSIMPVSSKRIADGSGELNDRVQNLNVGLQEYCAREGFDFVDVTSAISRDGMLNEELTVDGLHLNSGGYRQLAERIRPRLEKMYERITRK